MNIQDIRLGETYQYYWNDISGNLHHRSVTAIKINEKSVRVKTKDADGLEFRAQASELDNRQIEAF